MPKAKATAMAEPKKKKKKTVPKPPVEEEEEEEQPVDPMLDNGDDDEDDDNGDEENDDDGEEEEEAGDDDAEEEEEEAEEDEEGGEEEDTEAQRARKARARRNQRAKARNTGYRKWASEAGLAVGKRSFGTDIVKAAICPADVRRMAHFCSQIADGGIEIGEFKERIRLRDASLSSGPLGILHTSVESFARNAARELVARSLESTTTRITASNVRSVLRAFEEVSDFDFVCPLGIVRHAQSMQKLPITDEDEEARCEEAKFAKINHVKILREADKARDARKAEAAAKRLEAKEKRAAAATAVPEEAVAVCA
jgi:hypothetical protein